MSNPDFSQDPERVALAKELADATGRIFENCDLMQQNHLLREADRAITHLGSGYRLPEPSIADTLADAIAEAKGKRVEPVIRREVCGSELVFDGAQGPDTERPVSDVRISALGFKYASLAMDDANSSADAVHILCSAAGKLPKGDPTVAENATVPRETTTEGALESLGEGPGPDFAIEAAERERLRLIEAFMLRLAGNPAVMAKLMEEHNGVEASIACRLAELSEALAQEIQ